MSAVIQQEDVADSGKDDENKEITSDNTGNTSVGDDASNADFDNELNPNVLKTIDLPSVNAAGDIEKPLSHEKSPVDKSEGIPKEIDKCVGHSELSSISLSKAFDSHNMQKDTESAAKDTLDNIPSVSNITNPQVDDNLHVAEPGYKETAIDDASDSEIELRWSDDEYDDEINATPLSNEALKSLDIELGIADTDSIENSKKDIPEGAVISTAQSLLEVEKPNESVDDKNLDILTLPQNSMEIEYSKELVDGTHKTVSTIAQNPTKIVNPLVAVNNDPESVKIKSDAVNLDEELSIDNSGKAGKTNIEFNIETKQTQHDDTKSQLVESGLESADTEQKVESKLESANAIANESEKLMDIDIPTAESVSESVESNEKFTHLVKEMDEEDKISEIDIDETIVDLKQLIDQDEDTIKQLGLDVQKSNDKSDTKHKTEQSSKAIEEAKLMEVESEKVKDEIDDTLKDTKSVKNEDSQLIDENIAHEIRHIATVTETKTSLDTNLVEIPNIQEEKITESTSMDAEESEIITSNVENKHSNDTLENTPKIITDDIDFKSGVTTSKESSTGYIEETDNTKDILQMPDDISDIQHAVDSKIAIEEYENDKEKNSTAQLEKDSQNKNNSPADTPTDQKLLENYDNVENILITPIEKDIDMNEDHCKTSNETNLDECESVSKDGLKPDAEEFITPDITNDSIKINTDHRINRPDVMLDIPTQELDFEDFDDTDDQPVNTNENDSDLTTKTVTEIVNQLAKDTDKNTDENKTNNLKTAETMDREMKEINDVTTPDEKKTDETTTSDINMTSTDSIPKTNKLEGATNSDSKAEETLTSENDKSLEMDVKSKENANKPETIPQDDEKDLKSTENSETSENLNIQASKSTEDTKDITNKIPITQEDKSSEVVSKLTEKTEKPEIADPQPSTSEGITEEPQEVTDSLGLLAESSRVMDEDDDEEQEPEDDEADDGEGDVEDDDDFDPDDEESSNQTGEHSEESNPPHSEVDIHEEGIDIEFNNEADKIGLDSNDTNFDALLGDSTDIMDEVNEALNAAKKTCEETRESQQEPGSKSVESTEKISEPTTKGNKTRERRSSILAELLTKPAADMNIVKAEDIQKQDKSKKKTDSKTVKDIVDLGGSSDDDVSISKDSKQEAPSVIQKAELDRDEKDTTAKIVTESIDDFNDESMEPKVQMDDTEKSKTGEVFSLDSDDDDKDKKEVSFIGAPRENNKCINYNCTSDDSIAYYLADRMTIAYYGAARRRKRAVCQNCLDVVNARNEGLVSGIKDLRPLMSLRMARPTQTLLEISDSDSEGEDEPVGEDGARLLEDQLTDMLNEVWTKYNMDDRLKVTENYLEAELEKMQKDSEEVDKLLRDCQKATDELRVAFYSSFEGPRKELPSISIHDTPIASYACLETEEEIQEGSQLPLRYSKRRSTSAIETPAKKIALPFDDRKMTRSSSMAADQKPDEDKDISVVHLSAEAAPADLPPPGELVKPPLRVGLQVFAMKNQYGAWLRGKVLEIQPKANEAQFTICRVRFEHKVKNPCKALSARSIAYTEPCEVRMSIGTRVIALFKNSENTNKRGEFYYSGVIAEIPNPVNGYRYLVFFDDGYAQYVDHKHTRLVCESKPLVWEEVHPFSRDFVCNYLSKYPERPMVRVHPGQEVNVEWNGKWWDTKVIKVDAALVHVQFPDNRTEWIYRGSTRLKPLFAELLAAKRGDRARLPRSTKANTKTNMPYVEYTRSDDQVKADTQSAEDLRRQRSVAKKSTTIAQQISNAATDGVISRVVFYTPKNSVRPLSMAPHACGPQCRRSDLLSLKDLRTYNPLTKPLLSGWERQIVKHKASRLVMYRAPCGRRLRSVRELHRYLRAVRSDMPVDLFDYNPNTHCLAEFVLNKTNVQKKDLSHGKENVPVPCVNYYDHSLPEFCSYNTVRTPTAGVPLNLDPEFLCGCDCDDDCEDKTKCACWKMTLEGAKTIGLDGMGVGYNYRRLPEPLPSGIYECNSRCKCKSTCLNRVVQNPLQLKLQVFKTLNRGWGIRALNDVPKGAFICIYAGNLLTDATANLDGLNEGDEYLAELDYIEVVEAMKEGYEEDIPEADKILDKKESKKSESEPETDSTESEEEKQDATDKLDGDFQPGYLGYGISKFNKRLRRRDKKKNKEDNAEEQTIEEKKTEEGEDCITISDDEEVRVSQREPSRFAAQESMTDNKVVSKYRSIRSHFGKDEACYIMDAKVQGNIGRYLNHSCSPNVFVQNVFVDTHDPRFPWVSFFALHHIRAGTELTWNYNYDIGSVPGKVLYCYCGAPNCRRRLL